MKIILKKALIFFSAAAITISTSTLAGAAGEVETDRKGKLTLEYISDGTPLSGAQFSLYRVGDITSSASCTLSGDFASYPVSLKDLDSTGWNTAANTLSVYITADKINAFQTEKTDSQGQIVFDNLLTGLYLLKAGNVIIGTNTYRSAPFLVSLPALDEKGSWNYAVTAWPKTVSVTPDSSKTSNGGGGDSQKLTVVKVWNDEGYREQRPSDIEVALLRDGEVYRTVTLSSSNYWRHTWSGLSTRYSWEVVEDAVPDAYSVTYTSEDSVYTITNTVLTEILDGEVPLSGLNVPDSRIPLAGLPQTGLLWWPVPFLLLGGMLLFGFGYKDYYSGKRKKDGE